MSLRNNRITVYRNQTGSYVNGRWIVGSVETNFIILCGVQPFDPKELNFLPEGRRENDLRNLFTSKELFTLENGKRPDQVDYLGSRWEVIKVFKWQNNIINHYRYVIVKLQDK